MRGRIVVFAKSPVAGRVKTRIAATHGDSFAVELARASLLDTWRGLHELADPVLAWDGGAAPFDAHVIPQGDGDLGARLTRVLVSALDGAPWAIAIGSDSPGLPRALLSEAIAALATRDAVLGPADDGGFYLLGIKSPVSFAGIEWSSPETGAHMQRALGDRSLHVLPRWFDVDVAEDLVRLRAEIVAGTVSAPHVARVLGA